MKLLLVGQGTWSNKIKSTLQQSPELLSVNSISARECIRERGIIKNASDVHDIVWICTRPEWQLEILDELIDFGGQTIIEKPYLVDNRSAGRLFRFIESTKSRLQLSEPWTHTKIWLVTKRMLTHYNFETIQIQRTGSTGHNYINEVLDWLPHDVNLLFDFFGVEILNAQFSDILWSNDKKEIKFKLIISNSKIVNFRIGQCEEKRTAFWETENIKTDFSDFWILNGGRKVVIDELKNPFITQLQFGQTVDVERLKKQLQVHELFRHQLFS